MLQQLVALVVAFWTALDPAFVAKPHAPEIADAIAHKLEGEALGVHQPVYRDAVVDAAMTAYFAAHESSLDPDASGDWRCERSRRERRHRP
jgi:hypothetical protein